MLGETKMKEYDILDGMNYHEPSAGPGGPKYRQIAGLLADFLLAKKPPLGSKLPNDKELARRFNVALMTMSRALNELSSRGLLERKVGSGTFVRSLAGPAALKTRRIAIVCHEPITLEGGFVTSLLPELYRQAPEFGFDLMQLQRVPAEYAATVKDFQLAGIIVLSAEPEFLPQLAEMAAGGMNLVQLGMWQRAYRAFSFGTDHAAVAKMAVKYLHRLGHREIGFLASSITGRLHQSTAERIRGCQRALWELRLPFNPEWIVDGEPDSIHEQLSALKNRGELPSAFLLGSLPMAHRVYNIMRSLDLRIHEDVSLVGFDEASLCGQLTPGLTVFSQNIPALVKDVMKHLSGEEPRTASKPVSPLLIERESTAAHLSEGQG